MQKSEKNLMLTHPSTQELGNYVLLEPTYYTSATKLLHETCERNL